MGKQYGKQYIIIYSESYDKLEERCAEAMEMGYKPHGSLVFRPKQLRDDTGSDIEMDKLAFIQPMIFKN